VVLHRNLVDFEKDCRCLDNTVFYKIPFPFSDLSDEVLSAFFRESIYSFAEYFLQELFWVDVSVVNQEGRVDESVVVDQGSYLIGDVIGLGFTQLVRLLDELLNDELILIKFFYFC